jgi:sporulation protein YlmC with PRC-barrel domain
MPIQETVMRKELQVAAATALVALLTAPALAQNTTPAAPGADQPTAPMPAPEAAAGGQTPASASARAPAAGMAGNTEFVEAQQEEEMLVSDLMGTQVYNGTNESLGEINDVLLAEGGGLKAVVVGVGGFLGIAERDVAVPWDALEVSRDQDEDLLLRLDVSREQLENAPEFETVAERQAAQQAEQAAQTPPPAAVGVGAGGATAPAPAPGAPPATSPAQ